MAANFRVKESMIKIITPEFRLCFPSIWTPKENKNNNTKSYSILMLYPKATDIRSLSELLSTVCKAVWPDANARPKLINPIKDGDTVTFESGENTGKLQCEKWECFKGMMLVNATAPYMSKKTGLVNPPPDVAELVPGVSKPQKMIVPENLYAGCWCRAQVNVFAYGPDGQPQNAQKKFGVGFGLNCLLKTRDDTHFAGRETAENAFGGISGPPLAASAPSEADPIFG